MKTTRRSVFISLVIVIILIAALSFITVTAQDQNIEDLAERLALQGIPVISVTILHRTPYEIEIALQSESEDSHLTVADNWNMILASREATLTYRWGARLKTYKLVVYNAMGEVISSTQTYLYPQDLSQQSTRRESALDNEATADMIKSFLQPGGLTLARLEVITGGLTGTAGQILLIDASVENLDAANQSLPQFLESILWIEENLNREYGTKIVMSHLRVKDSQGTILLDYVRDWEGGHAQWTQAMGVYSDWFPHPPSSLYDAVTPEPGGSTAEGYPPAATLTPAAYP